MASFPSTTPSDSTEISLYLRWWLANISTSVLAEQDLTDLIDPNITLNPDDPCKATYYSAVDVIHWLLRTNAINSGIAGSSGSTTRRREKRGKTEIEVEYSDTDTYAVGWQKVLDDLLADPSSIGCDPFADSTASPLNAPIIGGADINGHEESFRTRNKFGQAIKDNRYGYNKSRFGRRLF